jgi:hypothetical protein
MVAMVAIYIRIIIFKIQFLVFVDRENDVI